MLGWLTPNLSEFTNPQKERTIVLPGDLFYLVTGAISQLADAENWEKFGDATPEETAEYFLGVLEDYLVSDMRNVGMISSFSSSLFPPGWVGMNGQTVAQADYPELTAVVPDTWKSGSNLVIPSTRGGFLRDAPVGESAGTTGGANTHALTIAEMPSHNHTVLGINIRSAGAGSNMNEPTGVGTSGNAGLGNAHNNMPQFVTVRFAVYAGR